MTVKAGEKLSKKLSKACQTPKLRNSEYFPINNGEKVASTGIIFGLLKFA
jgi:hypothetical protein